jgi:hypothetical protein
MESRNRNIGSLIGGALLLAFGALALLGQLVDLDFWGTFWPFIIVGFGAMFFVVMLAGGRSVSGLAIPGSIFTAIGLMMFVQNLTDHWESWSYGWTVIILAVGAGIFIMGAWSGQASQRQAGLGVMRVGLVLFIIFGAFFEMIFNSSDLAQLVFPVALILLGGYLLVTRSGLFGGGKKDETAMVEAPSQPTEEQK